MSPSRCRRVVRPTRCRSPAREISRDGFPEQSEEIGGRSRGELIERLIAQRRDEGRGVGDEGRLAGLAAVGDGGQERGVGLDQQPIGGDEFRGVLQVARILESDDARQADEKAEVECLAGKVGAAGEAVEDAGDPAPGDRGGEDLAGILLRIAGVDDEW